MPDQVPAHAVKLTVDLPVNPDGKMGTDYPVTAPPIVGDGLTLSAPNGFVNGEEIKLTVSGDTFKMPDAMGFIGFGIGWMYDNPLDTTMQGVSIADGSNPAIYYEYDTKSNRMIKSKDGIRVLESMIYEYGVEGDNSAAGNLTFDTETEWPAGTTFHMSSMNRITVGVWDLDDTDKDADGIPAGAQWQYKQERIWDYPMGSGASYNSVYFHDFHYGPKAAISNQGDKGWGRLSSLDGKWSYQELMVKQNTMGSADGFMAMVSFREGDTSLLEYRQDTGSYAEVGITAEQVTIQTLIWQHYIGSRNGTSIPKSMVVDCADLYCRVNGDSFLFIPGDSTDTLDDYPVNLVPRGLENSGSTISLSYWESMTDFSGGGTIIWKDKDGNVKGTVGVPAQ